MTQTTEPKSATRNGETIRYLDTGAGEPTIVFVHGWCCDNTHWRDQVPVFSRDHRVVALDLPGHGSSDKPDRDYSISGFVEDVAWLIRELGLDRPVVVGHSMGGTIALNLVRRHPEIARGIVMVDAPIAPFGENLSPLVDQALAAMQTPAYQAVAAGFVRMNMFNADSPPALVEEIVAAMPTAPQRVMYTAIQSTLAPESRVAGPIPVPALYIRAATQFATQHDLTERYPSLEVQTLAAAHFVQLEKPAETNALIAEFVGKVR